MRLGQSCRGMKVITSQAWTRRVVRYGMKCWHRGGDTADICVASSPVSLAKERYECHTLAVTSLEETRGGTWHGVSTSRRYSTHSTVALLRMYALASSRRMRSTLVRQVTQSCRAVRWQSSSSILTRFFLCDYDETGFVSMSSLWSSL